MNKVSFPLIADFVYFIRVKLYKKKYDILIIN